MASTLQAPNPALLDAVPAPAAPSVSGADHAHEEDEAGTIKLGPVTLGTSNMQLLFRTRQVRSLGGEERGGSSGRADEASGGGRRGVDCGLGAGQVAPPVPRPRPSRQ